MIPIRTLALPALLLAPPGAPLDADVFDASHLPSVVVDVVAPRDFAAVNLTPAMFTIAGGTVQSVAKVDPATVVVSLVIDDSPAVNAQAVQDAQGASLELVRNVGPGTQIALSTPSGLLTALTTDQAATIARISGIVAGSPDVIKLPDLVVDAAKRLSAVPQADRHLVVALGTPFPDGPPLQALRDIVIAAGIRLDVVASSGLDTGAIAELAAASGGISPVLPNPVGEMDAVTHTIVDRYHVSANLDGAGPHDVTLNVAGQTFGTTVEVPALSAAVPPDSAPPTAAPSGSVAPAPTPTSVATSPAAPATTVPASTSSGLSSGLRILIGLLLLAVAIGAWTTWMVLRRRAIAGGKRRKARADARARAADEETLPDAMPGSVAPLPPVGRQAPDTARAPMPGQPEAVAEPGEVEPATAEAEPVDRSDEPVVETRAATAPPLSIRADRRARKRERRKLSQGATAVIEEPSVAEFIPEAQPEPASDEPVPGLLVEAPQPEPEPVVIPPQTTPVAEPERPPEPEPDPEPAIAASAPEWVPVEEDGHEPAVEARRGRTLTDQPRSQTDRRPVPDPAPPSPVEPANALDDPSTRRGRRPFDADRSAAGRTRRGSPADLPKRARSRRRFDDIPLIDSATPAPPIASDPEVD